MFAALTIQTLFCRRIHIGSGRALQLGSSLAALAIIGGCGGGTNGLSQIGPEPGPQLAFSITGKIGPTTGGSGATVFLSGTASASTTSDSSGNYSFAGLANGSYTVAPSNTGFSFTPPSQVVTLSGANVSGVDFTAQVVVQAAAGTPVLFFSDLTSGPATGNSDPTYSANGGVYVTLYGNFFGSTLTASDVALNGSNCLGIVSQPSTWLWYQKFKVQLHSGCTTGNFTVTTSVGNSNGLPFTVQSENIYFASGSGNDSAAGSWTAPWKTLTHARSAMPAGSVVYAMTGSDATTDDGTGWSTTMLITQNGTATAPYAMVVYPGMRVQIGPNSGGDSSVRSGCPECPTNYWTFSGFHLVAQEVNSQWGSNNWRWIGNDVTCPNGNGQEGCFEPIESTYIYTYGNNFHNMGVAGASAEYHGVYLATDSSFQDFGWNEIGFSNGGRGLQTHSENNGPGTNGYGIWGINIHDNIIHDTGSDCMVGDSLSPNGVGVPPPQGPGGLSGPVTIYNNIFYNCGLVTPPEDTGDWSGIELTGSTTDGPAPSGTIYVFNNTFYAFGLNTNPPYGGAEFGVNFGGSNPLFASASNNILYSTRGSSVPYFGGGSSFTGTNNWMYNGPSASGASGVNGTIGANPDLTSVATFNFAPLSGSPVIGAGKPIAGVTPFGFNNISRDIFGNPRSSAPSVGAIE